MFKTENRELSEVLKMRNYFATKRKENLSQKVKSPENGYHYLLMSFGNALTRYGRGQKK